MFLLRNIYELDTLLRMTTALPNTHETTHEPPALLIGEYNSLPLVRINYVPDTITTGDEMANTILASMSNLIPDLIHPDCQYN